jgi:hypothetical protein
MRNERESEKYFSNCLKILFAHDDNNHNINDEKSLRMEFFCSIQQTIIQQAIFQQLYLVLTTCSRDLFWKRV